MNEEKINFLKSLTKDQYTHWLAGYLAGVVDSPIHNGLAILDEVTLKKIPALIDSTYKNVLQLHDYLGIDQEHYKIFTQMDEFETEIKLFYIKDGEFCETPFSFKLASLQKANLN